MTWHLSNRADPRARRLADRHYNRQSPGATQFVPPGRCLVLWQIDAFWVTSWPYEKYTRHEWAGAWICSAFRNEGAGLSSTLIREAVSATRWRYGDTPHLGMVTFVDTRHVASDNPGYCYKCAGFERVGRTKVNELIALQLLPEQMPEPKPPIGAVGNLFAAHE